LLQEGKSGHSHAAPEHFATIYLGGHAGIIEN
jgi:hypothetical protein